ncbi:MAG: WD40/YVTN/BNR-like repeat-containing protein, partial [Pyrinomonadaceae bacterium]
MKKRFLISVLLIVPIMLAGVIFGVKVMTAGNSIREAVPEGNFSAVSTNQKPNTKRANIDSMQLVTANTGWALTAEGQLLLTNNGGGEWKNITPGGIFGARVHGAFFSDESNGLAAISSVGKNESTLDFAITHDGGQNWVFSPLGATSDAGFGAASISFTNSLVGYVMVELPSS